MKSLLFVAAFLAMALSAPQPDNQPAESGPNPEAEADFVEVELDGGHNVLLCTQTGHNHLGVKDDKEGKEKSTPHCHCCLCQLASNEDIHESAKDEDKEAGVQCGADIGKVPLGLECEGSQANNHGSSQEER